jgi:hypothetical protein
MKVSQPEGSRCSDQLPKWILFVAFTSVA